MDAHTPMVLVLRDNEELRGTIEWYDKNSIKLHRNEGPNLPFGQGDTPIRETLRLLRDQGWKIPANIEWEVDGDRVAAVRQCLDYCRQVLDS